MYVHCCVGVPTALRTACCPYYTVDVRACTETTTTAPHFLPMCVRIYRTYTLLMFPLVYVPSVLTTRTISKYLLHKVIYTAARTADVACYCLLLLHTSCSIYYSYASRNEPENNGAKLAGEDKGIP